MQDRTLAAIRSVAVRRGRILAAGLVVLLLVGAAGCGVGEKLSELKVGTYSALGAKLNLDVHISPKANQNSPVALDLLVIYDPQLLSRVLGMTAKQWFEQKTQILRDYQKGESLDYWSWEWVPGQEIGRLKLPLEATAKGAVLFARYLTPGAHRIRIDPTQDIKIFLEDETFRVQPM